MEAVECGAAALAMVLAYYGKFVPLEVLRSECGVSRDGSKASNMLRVARKYGLKAVGYRKELDDIKDIKLPAIVFWHFNHFVVLDGWSNQHVHLNDPGPGRRKVSWEEFDDGFTGVILTFEKTPEFKRGGHKKSLWGALARRLKGSEGALLYVCGASLALVIPGLIAPSFMRVFVDKLMGESYHSWILWLATAMLATSLVQSFLTWLQQYYLGRLETRMALSQSGAYLWHLLRLPLEFYTQRSTGDIGSRVGLNDRVASLLGGQLASAVLNVLMIVFYGLVMCLYDTVLTGVVVGLSTINFVALVAVSKKMKDANMSLEMERGKVMGATMSGLRMIETLKATGRENDFYTRWAGYQAKLVNLEQKQDMQMQLIAILPTLITSISTAAVLAIGGLRVMEGALTVGMLIAFQSLMNSFTAPVNAMVTYGNQLQQAEADMNRLDDVLANKPEMQLEDFAHTPAQAERLQGSLELVDVSFGYSRLEPALIEGFNLKVQPGQRVALVGSTGSGKSTLAKLICGLHSPWSGQILFDGKTREQIPRQSVISSLATVDQDICMFAGTVRDNLTLWDTTVEDATLVRALQDAGVYERVMMRHGGLDGTVGEGGSNFSGGERQRLEIARALVGNPSLLILDEATSALDPLVEKHIDEKLRSRGCTCIIVAHRLSTIRDCDEIIVLERGKVIQRGIHEEMVRTDSPYRTLIAAELAQEATI